MWKALVVGTVLGATAAIAQAPEEASETRSRPSQDPNQVVCVNEGEIGSRLGRRRVCRTRAEWAAHEAEQRRTVERTQSYKPSCPNGRC